MSLDLAPAERKPPAEGSKPLLPSPIVRRAIDAMVWEGIPRDAAAKAAGMLPKSLYNAFTKPHVKRYYLDQLEVLRTSERARNIHTLCEVRDQTSNQMARVNAVAALERVEDQAHSAGAARQAPGFTILVQTNVVPHGASQPGTTINVKPNDISGLPAQPDADAD
jgi:hypothetical protein